MLTPQRRGAANITGAALDRVLEAAHAAGCPSDQVRNFLTRGYVPQPKQWEFHAACRWADRPDGPTDIATGGARGPGKSHAAFAQVALDDCQRFAGLKVLFLRKVLRAGREAIDDLRAKTLQNVPHETRTTPNYMIIFPNGSRIIVGNYKDEKDIEKYLGLEYDLIVIEEATQLSKEQVEKVNGSLRSVRLDYRQREYLTTNPGGVGHTWFRKKFVLPQRRGKSVMWRQRVWFVPANYKDNAFLPPEYVTYLEKLTGVLGRMWRDGDWDVGAGAYFTTFSYDDHVIEPFKIPRKWPVWGSFDYGFAHPTVFQLHARNPTNGMMYTIGEHHRNRLIVAEHAPLIHELTEAVAKRSMRELIEIPAGHDVFANRGDSKAMTIAQQYAEFGIHFDKATTDRINGAATVLGLLGNPLEDQPAGWQIFNTCQYLVESLPAMQVDPHRLEDVLKVDADEHGNGGDDDYDCARYGLHRRRKRSAAEKNQHVTRSVSAAQVAQLQHGPKRQGQPRRTMRNSSLGTIRITQPGKRRKS